VRRLLNPVQGGSKAAFDFRSHPSLAQHMVARMEALQSGASRTRWQNIGTPLGYAGGGVSTLADGVETIPACVEDQKHMRKLIPII
jgi:hypothetical protein